MKSISVKIASLLQEHDFKDEAENYLKNINGCIYDLKESIDKADNIAEAAYRNNYIAREESRQLQKLCGEILQAAYIFKARLQEYSKEILKDKGINLNPSFSRMLERILLARGAQTHIRDPFYTYRTHSGSCTCTCDVAPNSYQGECLGIVIEYKEQDDTVILSCEIRKLLDHIRDGVIETLSKYYAGLERHLLGKEKLYIT
jgi:hypothetical protein